MGIDIKLGLIFLSLMLINLLYTLIAVIYPVTAEDRGIPSWLVGMVFSSMAAISFPLSLWIGKNLSRIGRRKVITLGLLLASVALLLLAFIVYLDNTWFLVMSFASRMVGGVAMAFVYTAGCAIITSDYQEKAQKYLPAAEFFAGIGLTIGPTLGAVAYHVLGFTGITLVASVPFVLLTVLVGVFIKPSSSLETSSGKFEFSKLLKNPNIILDAVLITYMNACITFLDPSLGPYLNSLGYSVNMIGVAFLMGCVGYCITCLVLAFTVHKLDVKLMQCISLLTCSLMMALVPPWHEVSGHSTVLTFAALASVGVALACPFSGTMPAMTEIAESRGFKNTDQLQDAISGIFAFAFSMGDIAGPLTSGFLVHLVGFENAMLVMSGLGLALSCVYIPFSVRFKLVSRKKSNYISLEETK